MEKKFRCLVCGYIHEGENAPEECPLCHVGSENFEEIEETEGELTWADEHKLGSAKNVDPEILKGLRDHFNGECCEVGMYLAMSRQADRVILRLQRHSRDTLGKRLSMRQSSLSFLAR